MGINLKLPNITGTTTAEQMKQMQSYMYQMVEQLNWALSAVETHNGSTSVPSAVKFEQSKEISPKEAEDTFNSIKALIIKSADIVKAYEKTIITDFNGTYFADSDFGSYLEETNKTIEENSKGVKEVYTNVQTITNKDGTGALDKLSNVVSETNTYIKRGLLGYDKETGAAVYGIAVGETDKKSGEYKKYAWFTADKLSFFDANEKEVAYIGAGDKDKTDTNCLYILGKAVFLGDVRLRGYNVDTSDGLAFLWIG